MKFRAALLLDLVATGPNPRHSLRLDELEGTREVIAVIVRVCRVYDISGKDDEVWVLRVEHCLDETLSLKVVL